ncbi:MAG: deoxyribonuclease IV [candidate division WOR-3 bacterium]
MRQGNGLKKDKTTLPGVRYQKINMRLGFHISISGGFSKVLYRALKRECKTIQLFSRNPRGWKFNPLVEEDIAHFKRDMKTNSISPVFVHMPYLPNLGAEREDLFNSSVESVIEDLKRTERLGTNFLILHAGSNRNRKRGIERMISGINQAFAKVENGVMLLIENTAGAGNELGCNFEELKAIIDGVKDKKRIGIVFDTAHAFEAGYDLRTKKAVDATLKRLDELIGIERVHLVHFNDSKTKLGSRIDRHWHIAKGEIGMGMKYIINHPRLRHLPFIMETPRTDTKEDIMNMEIAQNLVG